MQTEQVEVKSKGQVVDTIEVQQFDSIQEALEELAGPDGDGEARCIELINRQYKADMCNQARAAKTRSASPMTQLKRLADSDPSKKAQINELLKQLGIQEEL